MIFEECKISREIYERNKEDMVNGETYMECIDFTNMPSRSMSMILPDSQEIIDVVNGLIGSKSFFGLFDKWLSNYSAYKSCKLTESAALLNSKKEIYRSLADQHLEAMKSIEEVIETPLAPFKWRVWEFDNPGLTKYLFVLEKGK